MELGKTTLATTKDDDRGLGWLRDDDDDDEDATELPSERISHFLISAIKLMAMK